MLVLLSLYANGIKDVEPRRKLQTVISRGKDLGMYLSLTVPMISHWFFKKKACLLLHAILNCFLSFVLFAAFWDMICLKPFYIPFVFDLHKWMKFSFDKNKRVVYVSFLENFQIRVWNMNFFLKRVQNGHYFK